jgi:hypothetical protein
MSIAVLIALRCMMVRQLSLTGIVGKKILFVPPAIMQLSYDKMRLMLKNKSRLTVKGRRIRTVIGVLIFGLLISFATNLLIVRSSNTGDIEQCQSNCQAGEMYEVNTRQYGFPFAARVVQKDLTGNNNEDSISYARTTLNALAWVVVLLLAAVVSDVIPITDPKQYS